MTIEKNCIRITNDSRIKVEENGRKAVFLNKQRISHKVTRIDGCVINSGIRCDFMVSRTEEFSLLVELKGGDVKHACDQLFAAAENEDVKGIRGQSQVGFLVVCSKFPRFDTSVARAKQKAAKVYGGGFHVVCSKGEFEIEKIVSIDGRGV